MSHAALLLAHAGATLAMAGLIWFVQIVHYPLFHFAAAHSFTEFSRQHQRRTGWVVAPLMLAEAAATILLALLRPGIWTLTGAALLAIVWLSTAFLQVPLHRRLVRGFAPTAARALVRTNWLRTVAWSARAAIALLLLAPGI